MHILRRFIKPTELAAMCRAHGLEPGPFHGVRPRLDCAFFKMLASGRGSRDVRYVVTESLGTGHGGVAHRG